MYKLLFVNIIITLANFWIWRVFKTDLILALLLILLSLLLFLLTICKINKKYWYLTLLLVLFIYAKMLPGFDTNLRVLTPDQQKQLNDRHGYLADNLGVIFKNKFSLRFYKDINPYLKIYSSNVFNSLSPNLYFFVSHPRERAGVNEFFMYPFPLIILFIWGLFTFSKFSGFFYFYFIFTLISTGFIKQDYIFGPLLFFPIMNLSITAGLLKIIRIKNDL